jgi:uncharacterized OsmC-like protein
MSIQEAVSRARAYLSEHPEEARYRDSPAIASLSAGAGLKVSVTGTSGERVSTDMPAGIGGEATEPSPGWLMRASAASCVASLVAIRAAAMGLSLGDVTVEVDSESDDRGILGLDAAIPAGPLSARVRVLISAPGVARTEIEDLVTWAVDHCPVTDAIRRAVPVEVEIAPQGE